MPCYMCTVIINDPEVADWVEDRKAKDEEFEENYDYIDARPEVVELNTVEDAGFMIDRNDGKVKRKKLARMTLDKGDWSQLDEDGKDKKVGKPDSLLHTLYEGLFTAQGAGYENAHERAIAKQSSYRESVGLSGILAINAYDNAGMADIVFAGRTFDIGAGVDRYWHHHIWSFHFHLIQALTLE